MWWIDEKATTVESKKYYHGRQKDFKQNFFLFIIYVTGFIGFILLTTGCSLFTRSDRSTEPAIFSQNPTTFEASDFKIAQENLTQITENHPDPVVRRKALYHLAKTMAHYNNPTPEYDQALIYFKQYIQEGEETPEGEETRNWIAVLQSFKAQSEKLSNLITQKSNLERTILLLKQEITKLKNNIKKLDSLYLEMERKRRRKK